MAATDLWADRPSADEPAVPVDPAPPWYWDADQRNGNSALRRRDGSLVLAIVRDGHSWGIYQMQLYSEAVSQGGEFELIQIRGDWQSARDCAIEMAKRVGLI